VSLLPCAQAERLFGNRLLPVAGQRILDMAPMVAVQSTHNQVLEAASAVAGEAARRRFFLRYVLASTDSHAGYTTVRRQA